MLWTNKLPLALNIYIGESTDLISLLEMGAGPSCHASDY